MARYYFECKDNPKLNELTELKESLEYIDTYNLEQCFGVVIKHDCWDTDEDGNDVDERQTIRGLQACVIAGVVIAPSPRVITRIESIGYNTRSIQPGDVRVGITGGCIEVRCKACDPY